jgi:surfactin synthase thioesterase subunit
VLTITGVIAFEVARYLQNHYIIHIPELFLSGISNPETLTNLNRDPFGLKLFKSSDPELLKIMKDMGGISSELYEHRRDLAQLAVPELRADFHILEHYVLYDGSTAPAVTLQSNITTIWGKQDTLLTSCDDITSWSFHTHGKHTHINLSTGSHHEYLFLPKNQEALCTSVCEKLTAAERKLMSHSTNYINNNNLAEDDVSTCSVGILSI